MVAWLLIGMMSTALLQVHCAGLADCLLDLQGVDPMPGSLAWQDVSTCPACPAPAKVMVDSHHHTVTR